MGIQDTLWRRGCKTGLYLVLNFPVFTGGDGRFEVDRKNGQVRTTGLPLQQDREYLLTVVAADQLGSRSIPAVLSVVAGSRPPQFSNTSFTIALPENTPAGQPWVHGTHRDGNFTCGFTWHVGRDEELVHVALLARLWLQQVDFQVLHTRYFPMFFNMLNFQHFFLIWLCVQDEQESTSNAINQTFW